MRHLLHISLTIALCLLALPSSGQRKTPRLTFGAEWMYSSNFYNAHQFNYTAGEEGYRVNDENAGFEYIANGGILGHMGIDVGRHFNASVYAGYLGVFRARNVIPVLAGVSWFPNGSENDGLIVNMRGGVSFQEYIPVLSLTYLASVGAGYRLSLARWADLDFLVGLQTVFDHPPIPNPDGLGFVPAEDIRKDKAQYFALNLGVSLSF